MHKLDMTEGAIVKKALLFALPLILGNTLQLLYNTVDTIVVGNYCGAVSIAAVGTSSQPIEILLCIFMGIGHGISILVSQATGKKENNEIKRLSETAVFFLFITALPLTAIGIILGPLILHIMRVPADTFSFATDYIRIVLAGTIGQMGYNINAGILRGMGDSRASVIFLLLSCIANVILDLVFVAGLKMNVAGAALATTIATSMAWFFSIYYIRKNYKEVAFPILPHKCDRAILAKMIKIGLPIGLNNSLYSFGHMALQSLVNMQGSAYMASVSVAGKITNLASIAVGSLSSAGLTFVGQNYGAGNYKRLKEGCVKIPIMSGTVTIAGGLFFLLFSRAAVSIFTKDESIIELALLNIRIVLPFSWCFAVFNAIGNLQNGMGKIKYTTIVNILMLWAVRIPSAYLINRFVDGKYIQAAVSLSFAFGMFAMLLFYLSSTWKDISAKAA